MMAPPSPTPTRCQLLTEDPDLAARLPAGERTEAESQLLAPVITLPRGSWHADLPSGGAGVLVLSGLIIRRMGIDGRFGAELLGQGDLLRPWQRLDAVSLEHSTDWRVLAPARLAVLDDDVTLSLARHPQLAVGLIDRAMRRARTLAALAIIHQSPVELRLRMLLWLLAERWGRVRPDGTLLAIDLTHELLAELTGARRPTVSTALAELARDGLVTRTGSGFLLGGPPPGELAEVEL